MLERLLSDVLDLARVEAGQVTIEAAPFDAAGLTRSVVALCRMQAEENQVAMKVEIEPAAEGRYLGDTVRVRQVLSNLLANAVKFTSEGEVRVRLEVNPDRTVRFTVSDTGSGSIR